MSERILYVHHLYFALAILFICLGSCEKVQEGIEKTVFLLIIKNRRKQYQRFLEHQQISRSFILLFN